MTRANVSGESPHERESDNSKNAEMYIESGYPTTRRVIQNTNIINIQCPHCGHIYKQAKYCPKCGEYFNEWYMIEAMKQIAKVAYFNHIGHPDCPDTPEGTKVEQLWRNPQTFKTGYKIITPKFTFYLHVKDGEFTIDNLEKFNENRIYGIF